MIFVISNAWDTDSSFSILSFILLPENTKYPLNVERIELTISNIGLLPSTR